MTRKDILDAVGVATMPVVQPEQHGRTFRGRAFQGIIVEYPSYCVYPEHKGKPYFSIKYTKNGQEFIGYGTYKPEALSEYLKEYFMPSAPPERKGWVHIDDIYRLIAGHSNYHGDNILSALTCLAEGKKVSKPIIVLDTQRTEEPPAVQPEKRTETHACDLISRQWLMECVNEGWIKFDTEKDENRFIHLVRDIAQSVQPQQWIPCNERLPTERGWYLGIFKEPDTGWINPVPFICDYVGKKTTATTKECWILKDCTDREEHIDYYFDLKCVAWMPLPKLYSDNM